MKQLLSHAQGGCKEAEDRLFDLLLTRFSLYARKWVEDRDVAADIAQETCITIFRKYKDRTFEKGFEAWAYGVLRMNIRHYYHKSGDLKRRKSKNVRALQRMVASDQSVDPDIQRALVLCVKQIVAVNQRYARALNLICQGYRGDDICQRMGVKRNHFYVILNRARSLLKECLGLEVE